MENISSANSKLSLFNNSTYISSIAGSIFLDRHHRVFGKNDSLTFDEYQGIGCAQIYGQIIAEKAEKPVKHLDHSWKNE